MKQELQKCAIVARNIRRIREKLKLTQEHVAVKAGMDRSYLSECESGKSNISLLCLCKIASALDVSESFLLADNCDFPCIDFGDIRKDVPLPQNLEIEHILTRCKRHRIFLQASGRQAV